MHRKIERWLEKLPEETESIILRAGDDRRSESIAERWTLEDVEDIPEQVQDILEDEIQGRLIAYGAKGRQLRSITVRTEFRPDQVTETQALVDGLLRMADEQRRFLATITDSFTVMHETIQDVIYKERETQEELGDLQVALAMEQMENASNEPSTADKALGIFAQVLQGKTSNPVQAAKELLKTNPEIIDSLLEDESIVDMVTQKMMNPNT